MAKLETKYMGISLNNPIIVSSSGLTDSVDKIKSIEANGGGAVVLKSLFEEQINVEAGQMIDEKVHTEALDYIKNYSKNRSVDDYLTLIKNAKKESNIPVIASINCMSAKDWTDFSKKIEDAGADGLELNLFIFPTSKDISSETYEMRYLELVEKINNNISIPTAVKIGPYITNLTRLTYRLSVLKTSAVVLFNRFYAPDIDINNLAFKSSDIYSSPKDISQSLRWIGILSDKIKEIDFSASTGIHDGEAIIKLLLAGAKTTQICSVLYKNDYAYINKMKDTLNNWMKNNNFNSLDDFRGKMSYKKIEDPSVFERIQFMKYYASK